MAGIPKVFRTTAPDFVNISFTEAVTNTGYINFYAGNTVGVYITAKLKIPIKIKL